MIALYVGVWGVVRTGLGIKDPFYRGWWAWFIAIPCTMVLIEFLIIGRFVAQWVIYG